MRFSQAPEYLFECHPPGLQMLYIEPNRGCTLAPSFYDCVVSHFHSIDATPTLVLRPPEWPRTSETGPSLTTNGVHTARIKGGETTTRLTAASLVLGRERRPAPSSPARLLGRLGEFLCAAGVFLLFALELTLDVVLWFRRCLSFLLFFSFYSSSYYLTTSLPIFRLFISASSATLWYFGPSVLLFPSLRFFFVSNFSLLEATQTLACAPASMTATSSNARSPPSNLAFSRLNDVARAFSSSPGPAQSPPSSPPSSPTRISPA
ncbi:hypothetical protein D9619_011152 [Psilocybe cf. subviscida]|uniref:Uncharacterized protein n=1 Tax=Psilocybe cf. subviscida TaxID=2480587 RepID=A0A8H5BJD4_9AGAR|nr:hypothetical protein D9619_011152 [Psilocybe cf. subviscida]